MAIIAGVSVLAGIILGPKIGEEIGDTINDIKKDVRKNNPKVEEVKPAPGETIETKQEETVKPEEGIIAPTPEQTIPPADSNNKIFPGIPTQEIEDKTSENIESKIENSIDYEKIFAWQEEQQKKLWEREDKIRKEVQDREDNAYQRAVDDMRKAGINPNLINVQPAESGGGITQATGMNMELFKAEISKYLGILETELNNSFKGQENTKDRITDTFTTIMQLFSMYMMFQGKKGAK